jgi:hypothetical protein
MQLSSVRALKKELQENLVGPWVSNQLYRQSLGVRATRLAENVVPPTLALGVKRASSQSDGFQLAVRVQQALLLKSPLIDQIKIQAKGEIDVQYVGLIRPRQAPWYQLPSRPLRIGCSIAHYRVTAGSLGGVVRTRDGGKELLLSNNHVFADENRGAQGDDILQPGSFDGGQDPADCVGTLSSFIPIDFKQANLVDCATAAPGEEIDLDPQTLTGFGRLNGVRNAPLTGNETVSKIGRTTGATTGTITAIELDNLVIDYDQGQATFDSQIEIAGGAGSVFSEGGDSGSLIFDQSLSAVALLFAGSSSGGTGNLGLTYANPILEVLDQLKADLLS